MNNRIYISSDEKNLRSVMYSQIKEQLIRIRSGLIPAKRLIMVVPAQETLLMESEAFEYLHENGFMDLLVMSGAKLRSEIFRETGQPKMTAVTSLGRSMLIRSIINRCGSRLSIFSSSSKNDGFIDSAKDFIVQLRQNDIGDEDLAEMVSVSAPFSLLSQKLSDMRIVYSEYQKSMAGKFTDNEDLLEYAAIHLKDSLYIRESLIWYCDFYSFNKTELNFLRELSHCSAGFFASFCSDGTECRVAEKTASELSSLCSAELCNVGGDCSVCIPSVINCTNSESQAKTIALDILKRRREGLSYSDFLVLCQQQDMSDDIKNVFSEYGIPFFADEKKKFSTSLCASVLEALINISSRGFNRNDIFCLLESGMFGFSDNEKEIFRNYVKKYKVYDKAFEKEFKYGKNNDSSGFQTAENIRKIISEVISDFVSAMHAALSVKEKCTVLYIFLREKLDLPGFLQKKADLCAENGFLDSSEELQQSFDMITDLLEQMAELIGDDIYSPDEFAVLLHLCFSDIELGILPQASDCVKTGSISRSFFSTPEVMYIAGFNEGIIPSDSSCDGILTDEELTYLISKNFKYFKNGSDLLDEEHYRIFRALSTRSRNLILLYTSLDSAGEKAEPSHFLQKYNGLPVLKDVFNDNEYIDFIQSPASSFDILPSFLKSLESGESVSETWKSVYNNLKNNEACSFARSGSFFTACQTFASPEKITELLKKGGREYLSPSQLEKFSLCPFMHFVQYGLKADEAEEFSVGSRESGTIYHEVVRRFSQELTASCIAGKISITDPASLWMTISEDEIEKRIRRIIALEQENLLDGIMTSDSQTAYKSNRITSVCKKFILKMIEQIRSGSIKKMLFEQKFSSFGSAQLPALEIPLSGGNIRIEGIVDRIDFLDTGGAEYVKVIDYKSGEKKFSLDKARCGLDLQLVIYLEAVMASGSNLRPAGVFYYRIADPKADVAYADYIADDISGDLRKKLTKEYVLDGILVDDEKVLHAVDKNINDPEKFSTEIFDSSRKNGLLISSEQMDSFRKEFRDSLIRLCSSLESGDIEARPAVYKGENLACRYCLYNSICMRELSLNYK